jgi:trimeric autotransporter adhesin
MTYVSALGAQADPEIVSGSTIERKIMSTKTIYKRIALVAVAALGMGVISSVSPASAYSQIFATGTPTVTVSTATVEGSQTQVSGANNFVQVVTSATAGLVTISGSTLSSATATTTVATGGLSAVQSAAAATYTIPTKTAGTITLNFYSTSGGVTSTTITDQLIITVIDAATLLASPTNSTSIITGGSTGAGSADVAVSASNLSTGVQAANINVEVKDGTAAKTAVSGTISATITGPGVLGIHASNTNTVGTAKFASLASVSAAVITVWADRTGLGGTSEIKIYSGTVLIATETVKFYGAVKTLASAAIRGSILDTATSGDALFAAVISAVDSSGTAITLDATELSVDAAAATAAGVSVAFSTPGVSTVSGKAIAATDAVMSVTPTATKTGNKTITVTHTDPATAVKTTLAVSFTVGLAKATTAVLTTDKATYLPGEKITLTLTLKDAGTFATADDATGTDILAAGGITTNVSLVGDTTTATAVPTVGGKKTWTLYAPLASGPIVFAGKTGAGTNAPATAVTLAATATVSDSATMSALTTLINSLIAKINALNKLVIKIQKKVKA